MYGDVAQCKLVRIAGITEADVFKIHTPVFHDGVARPVRDVNGLVEHLVDADGRDLRHRQQNEACARDRAIMSHVSIVRALTACVV